MGFKARLIVFGYPLAEFLTLWAVASLVGWGWALLGIVAGIPIGLALIRNAASSAAGVVQAQAADDPARAATLLSSMTGQFVAGALIAIPGYLTDVVGLAMLLPRVRSAVGRTAMRRYQPWMSKMPGSGQIIAGTVIVREDQITPNEPTGPSAPSDRDEPPALSP